MQTGIQAGTSNHTVSLPCDRATSDGMGGREEEVASAAVHPPDLKVLHQGHLHCCCPLWDSEGDKEDLCC